MTLALFVALLGAEAGSVVPVERMDAYRSTLNTAEARWHANTPASYSYRLIIGGPFGYTTHVVRVKNETCTARWRASFGREVSAWQSESCGGRSINDIFTELRRQMSFPQERVEMAFDARYGFPINASFEPHTDLTDQSEYFEIKSFKVRKR